MAGVLVLLVCLLVCGGVGAGSAVASFLGKNGRVAFMRGVPGVSYLGVPTVSGSQIHTARISGRGERTLPCALESIAGGCDDAWPSYSPDGRKLAFTTQRNRFLAVADADGSNVRILYLTGTPFFLGEVFRPRWSADGRRLVYSAYTGGKGSDAYTVSVEDPRPRGLPGSGPGPDWSSRNWIVSVNPEPYAPRFIYRSRPDGSRRKRLTRFESESPTWSPDGRRVAFVRAHPCCGKRTGVRELYVMAADGTRRRRLRNIKNASTPIWSPDGKWIAFTKGPGADDPSYRIRPDGTGLQRLPGLPNLSDWQPLP